MPSDTTGRDNAPHSPSAHPAFAAFTGAAAVPSTQAWAQWLQTNAPWMAQPPQLEALPTAADVAAQVFPVRIAPDKLQQLQQQYLQEAQALWQKNAAVDTAVAAQPFRDKRFNTSAWSENPVSSYTAASYLMNVRALQSMADAVEGDEKTRSRIRFAVEQWAAAMAPSNFWAFNAEAHQKALQTQGESISKGINNMIEDMRRGYVSMTDESKFEVGRNVGTSEGAVVFENAFFQLIEYKPLTERVYSKPFLLVPPCINKFYILDLQPENSLIRYAVEQGQHTFVMSWCNPDESMAQATWDDYVEKGVLQAIQVVQEITGARQINALGFCVGGTILSNALGVLAARGQSPVASATFLTTLIDFSDTGVLDIFIDEAFVQYREMQMGQGGLLNGQELASTFSFLRPNELVWNYVVGNYMKGEAPPPFDLLFWNSDSTNLPGPFYAWYLRHFYLQNRLIKPKSVTVCGEKIDLGLVDLPVYIYGSREDHIVPIGGAYASTQVLPGPKRFVMGASGHIAGVINPPSKNKRSHWIREDGKLPATVDEWREGAQEHAGSWWTDWSRWLQSHGGAMQAAPQQYGSKQYPVIEAAPGRYVKQKAQKM